MRVRFDLEAIRDMRPLKSARYQEHQPHEDSVFFTVPAEYITTGRETGNDDTMLGRKARDG